ncbi:hypothetical protein [Dactylosporangium sp. NPDC051541]|uniref:hypothetical protein n=1 Tax=Dactylosporangium sp. NPDC051541 TaxID=3363977 RepID=UPI0037B00116
MYVRAEHFGLDTVRVSLEVLQASNWTYLATHTERLLDPYHADFRLIRAGTWVPTERDVYIRLVLAGNTSLPIINGDDLTVSCSVP